MSNKLTPLQAIKKYCKKNCCAGDLRSWKDCTAKNCLLFSFRLGHKPRKANNIKKQAQIPITFTKTEPLVRQEEK